MADLIRTCTLTSKEFVISTAEQAHIAKFESLHPLLQPGDIPLPTIHPTEFLRQMQSYVTLMALFDDKSCISGKPLITRYNPILGYKVCTTEEFWSDKVDNTSVGRPYDFSRPFFEQWNELLHECILQPLVQINCENSRYVDSSSSLRNCYLCFGMGESEDCLYCLKTRYPLRNRDCVDCIGIVDCELCYSCVHCDRSYACQHCTDCQDSYQCFGSTDLIGCKYCFGCIGLRQTEYAIFNEVVGKEAYEAFMLDANIGSYQLRTEYLQKCLAFVAKHIVEINTIKNSEESSGCYLDHCKNAYQCEFGENLEDCGWSTGAFGKDIWRGEVYQGELGYQSSVLSGRLGFCNSINTGSENFYSYMIFGSNSCFGCAMLKQKSYCILNKQYSKEEYEELVPRIIAHMKSTGEWGQFLPGQYAPHLYEETQAGETGGRRAEVRGQRLAADSIEGLAAMPDHIKHVDLDAISQQTFRCVLTGKSFKMVMQEVRFYVAQNIPLPRVHWQERLRILLKEVVK